jgi:uncharacterized protein (TIGR03083 family)
VSTDRDTYLATAEAFCELVERLPDDLAGAGLGEWDLRSLVGHTSRALLTVSTYLEQEAGEVELESAAGSGAAARGAPAAAEPGAVAERGRQAGATLGDDPAAAVRAMLEAVADALVGAPDDRTLPTALGVMRLGDYLPTRTLELVVHGDDIAAATGVAWDPPADAVSTAAAVVAEAAVLTGRGRDLLRLLTGREQAPFSLV